MSKTPVLFSQTAIYYLSSLNNLLRKEKNRTYRLSKEADVNQLIQDAKASKNPRVVLTLNAFRASLPQPELEKIGL